MTLNINEIPRVHCFEGLRVSLDDICGNLECKQIDCLWHRKKGKTPPSLGADNNRTEAMTKMR